jgi:hypothetical protein
MSPKFKRMSILWARNMVVAFGLIFGLFAFGFGILLLNTYFGTALFSILIVTVIGVGFVCNMCYKIAQDQFAREQRRSEQVMDRLKKEYP